MKIKNFEKLNFHFIFQSSKVKTGEELRELYSSKYQVILATLEVGVGGSKRLLMIKKREKFPVKKFKKKILLTRLEVVHCKNFIHRDTRYQENF